MLNRILALLFVGALASVGCDRNDDPMVGEPERTNGEELERERTPERERAPEADRPMEERGVETDDDF
jgi:hypothetical protein